MSYLPDSLAGRVALGAGALAVIALGATALAPLLMGGGDAEFAQCRSSTAVADAAIGGDFTLTAHTGEEMGPDEAFATPSLVYFGYTWCPDVCPLDTQRNAEAVDLLDAQGVAVTPVFVTIDPERDTVESLAGHVPYVHERMIGLTGTAEQIDAAARAYKVYYAKSGEGENYLMDHSTFTYLVHPEDGFVDFFRRDLSAAELAERVACYAPGF